MRRHLYDDGRITCDEDGVVIHWYYPWGSKRIPYRSIRANSIIDLAPVRGKWRLWGSGDLVHWYNLDGNRPKKASGIELDLGGRVRPCATLDDVEAVVAVLQAHLAR